jgi:hypothetical protein
VLFTSFSRDRADPDGALAKRVEEGVTRERACSKERRDLETQLSCGSRRSS